MSAPQFVHLRLHSEYSVADGIVRLDDAIAAALADHMPALALSDLNNLFGPVKFYKAARSKGVKPIIGCDVWLDNDADRDQTVLAILLSHAPAGGGCASGAVSYPRRFQSARGGGVHRRRRCACRPAPAAALHG